MTHSGHKGSKATTQKTGGHVRQFVFDHRRWFTFIGAIIVFVTFVAKEVLSDNLKDLVGALENAQTLFELRGDNSTIRNQILDVKVRISDMYDKVMTPAPGSEAVRDIGQNLNVIFENDDQLRLIDPTLANLDELVGKLPANGERKEAVMRCQTELQRAREASAQAKAKIDTLGSGRKFQVHPPPFTNEEQGQLAAAIGAMAGAQRTVWQDVQDSTLKIFKEAREYKEEKELQYKHWTWASYGLYTLGWAFGLAGRFYGISGDEGQDG
jgi:hypothetical protein